MTAVRVVSANHAGSDINILFFSLQIWSVEVFPFAHPSRLGWAVAMVGDDLTSFSFSSDSHRPHYLVVNGSIPPMPQLGARLMSL